MRNLPSVRTHFSECAEEVLKELEPLDSGQRVWVRILPNHFGGYSRRQTAVRDIPCDDRSHADHAIFTNRHGGVDNRPREPCPIPNSNRAEGNGFTIQSGRISTMSVEAGTCTQPDLISE